MAVVRNGYDKQRSGTDGESSVRVILYFVICVGNIVYTSVYDCSRVCDFFITYNGKIISADKSAFRCAAGKPRRITVIVKFFCIVDVRRIYGCYRNRARSYR